MKSLKVIIITNDEESSVIATKIVTEKLSTLKLSISLSYIKSFNDALRDKLAIVSDYDLVCVFTSFLSMTMYDVIYKIIHKQKYSTFSVLSISSKSLDGIRNGDEAQIALLLNETGLANLETREVLKGSFGSISFYEVKLNEIIDPVCVFSHDYLSLKLDGFTMRKCQLIGSRLNHHKIKHCISNPDTRILFYVSEADLKNVKCLIERSKLTFWKIWSQMTLD